MILTTQGTLILIVFGGMALSHIIAGFGESLIRKGSLELDRDALNRITAREVKSAALWRAGETAALVVMIAGIAKVFFISVKYGSWGIPAMAAGFALFCLSNVIRAWVCRTAYEREAPGSKASRGALLAGIMTTLAECLVAGAVCVFIYTHLQKSSHSSTPVASSSSPSEGEKETEGAEEETPPSPQPKPPPKWVNAADALKILKDRNMDYLNAIARRQDIRSQRTPDGGMEYHRDDLVKLKRDGMPTWEELELKNPNPPKDTAGAGR